MEGKTVKNSTSKVLMKLSMFFTLLLAETVGLSLTVKGKFLHGYELGSPFHTDWLGCLKSCQEHTKCVSYNINIVKEVCQLNYQAVDATCKELLVDSSEHVFHQIKSSGSPIYESSADRRTACTCNCGTTRQCVTAAAGKRTGIGYVPERPAGSCREILLNASNSPDGAYYLSAMTTNSLYSKVYCQMSALPGCGDGGWTLVIKADGNQQTFSYDSSYWTSLGMRSYKEENGVDMSMSETFLPTYWSTKFTRLCLGMTYKGVSNWIPVEFSGGSLMAVIRKQDPVLTYMTNMTVDLWKSLLPDSSIHTDCTRQGFSVKSPTSGASARIGIIGFPNNACNGTAQSRIGFGTSGDVYGMVDNNSCGNEARNNPDNDDKSIKTFGYVFIQ